MLKDVKAIIGIILAPVVITFLFSLMGSSVESIHIGVAVEADNEINTYLLKQLEQDTTVSYTIMPREELTSKIENQKLITGIVLAEGTTTILKADMNAYHIIKSKINTIHRRVDMVGTIQTENHTSIVKYLNLYKQSNKGFITGFIINFMMFSMIYIITEIHSLKKSGVLRRTYTTPHKSYQILGGIMISMFGLLMIQVIVVNIMSLFLFQELLFVNFFASMLVMIPFIFAILGLGLLLARVFKNPDISPVIANILIIPTGMVSGTFLPDGMLPDFLSKFAFLAPQYWVSRGLDSINQSIIAALPSIIILILLALVLLATSSYNFTKLLSE